jgi:hypothetical protein
MTAMMMMTMMTTVLNKARRVDAVKLSSESTGLVLRFELEIRQRTGETDDLRMKADREAYPPKRVIQSEMSEMYVKVTVLA